MARSESDKEDLMLEATALVERNEFVHCAASGTMSCQVLTLGYRSNGSLTVYFDQDPFYQFDADGRLRRAFANGLLYRTQGNTLAELRRERTAQRTTLVRSDLDGDRLNAFRNQMIEHLKQVTNELASDNWRLNRSCPEGSNLAPRTAAFLTRIIAGDHRFLAPAVAHK